MFFIAETDEKNTSLKARAFPIFMETVVQHCERMAFGAFAFLGQI